MNKFLRSSKSKHHPSWDSRTDCLTCNMWNQQMGRTADILNSGLTAQMIHLCDRWLGHMPGTQASHSTKGSKLNMLPVDNNHKTYCSSSLAQVCLELKITSCKKETRGDFHGAGGLRWTWWGLLTHYFQRSNVNCYIDTKMNKAVKGSGSLSIK